MNMNRRDLNKLLLGAAGGILAGCQTDEAPAGGSVADEISAAAPDMQPMAAVADKHVCKGMNECKGQGGCATGEAGCAGKNSCKGQGGCATSAKHECAGKNECKGQGGCGGSAGKNDCKGQGGCAVPVPPGHG